jgi:DNA mismatch endonuclease, patch repair protein
MAAVKSTGNQSTEKSMIGIFRTHGITGWRRGLMLPGRPDFAFPGAKVAVFVDGCFWHGCKRCFKLPRTNTEYWEAKIARNKSRDRRVNKELKQKDWVVLRYWEHQLARSPALVAKKIAVTLSGHGERE